MTLNITLPNEEDALLFGRTIDAAKQGSGKGLLVGGVKLPLALAELGVRGAIEAPAEECGVLQGFLGSTRAGPGQSYARICGICGVSGIRAHECPNSKVAV